MVSRFARVATTFAIATVVLTGCGGAQCLPGLKLDSTGTCVDVDECATRGSILCPGANAQCMNLVPTRDSRAGYACGCRTGFSDSGGTCIDTDECAVASTCGANSGGGTCQNIGGGGGYDCMCNAGFRETDPLTEPGVTRTCVDIRECDSASTCGASSGAGTCVEMAGGYSCQCNTGYSNPSGTAPATCSDINECLTNNGGCNATHGTCTNNLGAVRTCGCDAGYSGDGISSCTNIDECATNVDDCGSVATCVDTPGSFTCVCPSGYFWNGTTCADQDECVLGTDNCDANATCANTLGNFSCTCNMGYSGSGSACSDVNECLASNGGCDSNAACANTIGSRTCTCNTGFSGSGVTCMDVNECGVATTCGANAGAGTCANTTGGYQCTCSNGYQAQGSGATATCVDVNECTPSNPCINGGTCVNSAGSYSCNCSTGWNGTNCATDVNECMLGTAGCANGALCTNVPGTFTCTCPTGTLLCGGACVDTNVDPQNCGGCGNILPAMQYCANGSIVTTPYLASVNTVLAQAGDSVLLNGTFGSTATVAVGGVAASGVVSRGAGRIEFTVPAGATAGDVSVTTGGKTTSYGTLRRVGFTLGMDEFRSEYEQENHGRQMPFHATARAHATWFSTDRWWYVIGGANASGTALRSVERAMINADGTVGEFQSSAVQLVSLRAKSVAVRVGGYVYVVGGSDGATELSTVERASINADGTLSAFTSYASSTLSTPRAGHAALVIGGYLYVIGGTSTGSATASIERAPILGSGALGAFSMYSVSLATAREGASVFTTGTHVVVVGGRNGAVSLNTVEASPLAATYGAAPSGFASAGTLATGARSYARAVQVGSHVFLVGGVNAGGSLAQVDELLLSGTTPVVTAVPTATSLQVAREAPTVAVLGNHIYVAGGVSPGGVVDTVERASVNVSGELGTRTLLANKIGDSVRNGTSRSYVAIGAYLYLLGGGSNGNGVCGSGPWPALRWPVALDGSLGTVEVLPYSVGGLQGSVFVVGGNVCVSPGRQGATSSTNSILCAAIGSDGSLGAFTQATTTPEAPEAMTVVVLRSAVYRLTPFTSLGGSIGGAIYSAPVSGGLPGTFVNSGAATPAPYASYAYGAPALINSDFFALGGQTVSVATSRIDRISFDGAGNVSGTPSTVAASGGAPNYGAESVVVGPYVYAFGGGSPIVTSVARAQLANGMTPAYASYPARSLATPRQTGGAIALGNYVYVLGGYDGATGCNAFSGSSPDVEQFQLQ